MQKKNSFSLKAVFLPFRKLYKFPKGLKIVGSYRRLAIFSFIVGMAVFMSFADCVWAGAIKRGLRQVDEVVHTQTGQDSRLTKDLTPEQIQEAIEVILQEPLTEEGAVKIALLNNPSLKAAIARLAPFQADLIQGRLVHNPTFSASIRESDEEGSKTNSEFEVKQDVMSLFFWPLRKRLADARFKHAEYELAKTVVDFIQDVRTEFYRRQAADDMLSMTREYFKAQESNLELARRQKEAGNINQLVLAEHKAVFQEARIALTKAELETDAATRRLNNILGLTMSKAGAPKVTSLPDLPADDLSLDSLEERALNGRVDLTMKRQEIKILEQSMSLARWGAVPQVEAGFNTEREPSGHRTRGPVLEAELPVFDHKQAERPRVRSQIDVSQKELTAMESQVRLEVQIAFKQLTANRIMVETYLETIPVHQEIVKETLYHYNYMLKGVYDLLRTKQDEIGVQHRSIESLRDYWIARAQLEHAVGEHLPVAPAQASRIMFKKESEPEHHHGGHQ
jgi:cobalt-zinc-cadmium efflux system outer membrane protein